MTALLLLLCGGTSALLAPRPVQCAGLAPDGEAEHNVFAPCDRNNLIGHHPPHNDLLYPSPEVSAEAADCECCPKVRQAMEGYCKRELPMGDLDLRHFNCTPALLALETPDENARAPGDGSVVPPKCLAKCEAEHVRILDKSPGCGLGCTSLPECPVCSPPPPPQPRAAAVGSVGACVPVPKRCCEATLLTLHLLADRALLLEERRLAILDGGDLLLANRG